MIDITKLDADSKGKRVRYVDWNEIPEFGEITSFNDKYIHVKFDGKNQPQACTPDKLTFEYAKETN